MMAQEIDSFARTIANGSNGQVHDEEEKIDRVDNGLQMIESARSAKWYYSTFHNITAMVGAGVLSFPYVMSKLGWTPGILVLVLSWTITLYTLWQMIEMHEMIPGKRFDRYHELGQEAFGEKLGIWVVVPQQLMVEVGTDIVYMVTGGQSLQEFHKLVCVGNHCKRFGQPIWIVIFALPHFLLSQLPNFNAIFGVSLAAAVMSLSYSTIAWGASLHHGRSDNASYDYKFTTPPNGVFQVFSALGAVAFAFAGHNVVLEIQATLPSTPKIPSKVAMWRGTFVAYIIVAICYFGVALFGYRSFGNAVKENILESLQKPTWLIAAANLMVVVHLIGSYQIYAMPVFDMMETLMVKKMHLPSGVILRLAIRSLYVAFTCFVAATVPFFSDLLGFFGGFALAPTTYFLPCIMWLYIYKPKPFDPSWLANWSCIILGVLLMFVSSIGGLRQIIIHASTYKFFSNNTNNT